MKDAKEILHVMWFGSGLDRIKMAIRYGYDYNTVYQKELEWHNNNKFKAYLECEVGVMTFLSRKAYNLL